MKLYIGNLSWGVNSDKLKDIFKEYNPSDANVIVDKFSKRSKGFGFVTIDDDAAAAKAIEDLNGKDVEGRELKVSEAKPMEPRN